MNTNFSNSVLVLHVIFSAMITSCGADQTADTLATPTVQTSEKPAAEKSTITTMEVPASTQALRYYLMANTVEGAQCVLVTFVNGVQQSAEPADSALCKNSQVTLAGVAGPAGAQGPQGVAGVAGTNGQSCALADRILTCGGNSITFADVELHQIVFEQTQIWGEGDCTNPLRDGFKIESGMDLNDNSVLDAPEITNTSYLCSGVDGTDRTSLHLKYNGTDLGEVLHMAPDYSSFMIKKAKADGTIDYVFRLVATGDGFGYRLATIPGASIYYAYADCNPDHPMLLQSQYRLLFANEIIGSGSGVGNKMFKVTQTEVNFNAQGARAFNAVDTCQSIGVTSVTGYVATEFTGLPGGLIGNFNYAKHLFSLVQQ